MLDVLQAGAPGDDVVGDVEDVIGLMVGQVPLEELQFLIDVLDEADAIHQTVNGADASDVKTAISP